MPLINWVGDIVDGVLVGLGFSLVVCGWGPHGPNCEGLKEKLGSHLYRSTHTYT